MKKTLSFLFFLFLILNFQAQRQYVMGTVFSESDSNLADVTVYNVRTDEKTETDIRGNFVIPAKSFDELRFVKRGYERFTQKLSDSDFREPLRIVLVRLPQEIEEVEIAYKPTGKLEKDLKHYGDTKETRQLKSDIADYIAAPSAPEVLAAKPGEFVQPVGPGFSVGKIDNKWDDVDFMKFLITTLGEDFFIQELKLKSTEIQPFIFYVFRNFERFQILKYGYCSPPDLTRFTLEATKKVDWYRQNLPNDPPKKKSKRYKN